MDRPPSREPRATGERSVLLTVLGEFLLPRQEPAWTGALLSALGEVGVEEKAARQALRRSARRGLVTSERAGRRARWRLTPAGTTLLAEGADRIFGFGRGIETWDGRWLVLVVSLPESQRLLRDRLRTRLSWAGLGSPLPGLWVTPDVAKAKEAAVVLDELGVEAFSVTGPFGDLGEEPALVRRAWALRDVERRYREFVRAFAALRPRSSAARFRSQIRLVQAWSRFPYLDPGLPSSLLPATWPGASAARLFRERHEEWHEDAQGHWEALAAAAARRS